MRQSTIWRVVASAAVVAGTTALAQPSWAQSDPPMEHGQQQQPMQDPQSQQPTMRSTAQLVTKTATIQKIDKANGTVTMKTPEGTVAEFKAGPNVSLDKLKVGETVSATYYEEMAVSLNKKPSQATPSMTQKTTQRGGVAVRQTTATARILSVDASKNTIKFQGPRGVHTLAVQDPDVQAELKQIKAGDNVEVTYTQALAVSIEPKK